MRFINPDCCKSLRFESITLLKNNRTWTKKEFCDGFITSCPSFQNLIELEHFFLWSNLITIYIIFNYFLWTNAWKLLEEHYSMPSCPAVAVLHVQELITDPLQEFQKLPNSSYFDANTGFESLVWRNKRNGTEWFPKNPPPKESRRLGKRLPYPWWTWWASRQTC